MNKTDFFLMYGCATAELGLTNGSMTHQSQGMRR
jgi:hypothetical protein